MTANTSALVALVLLPAADLHQHAKDVVGVRASNGGGITPEAFHPHLDGGHYLALDLAYAVARREHITAEEGPALGNIHAVPILGQQGV